MARKWVGASVLIVAMSAGWVWFCLAMGDRNDRRVCAQMTSQGERAGLLNQPPDTCPHYFATYGEPLKWRAWWMDGWRRGDEQRRQVSAK